MKLIDKSHQDDKFIFFATVINSMLGNVMSYKFEFY